MAFKFTHIACGGTFDLLHKGHQKLLETAFKKSRFVSIGITCDKMNKRLSKPTYQNQTQRKKELIAFLKKNDYRRRSKIIWLNDIFGTTLSDKTIKALVVSKETLGGAKLVNRERVNKKLGKLALITCPNVKSNDQKMLSSSRIRKGEIDRKGKNYLTTLLKISASPITKKVRSVLKKALGPQVVISKKFSMGDFPLVAVGDLTVATFLKIGIWPNISIVDFHIARQKTFNNLSDLGFTTSNPDVIIKNPAGVISKKIIREIHKAIVRNKKTIIQVIGEEDLAAIPAILLSPLGTHIFYGQPNKGTIDVTVIEKIKDDICGLFGLR